MSSDQVYIREKVSETERFNPLHKSVMQSGSFFPLSVDMKKYDSVTQRPLHMTSVWKCFPYESHLQNLKKCFCNCRWIGRRWIHQHRVARTETDRRTQGHKSVLIAWHRATWITLRCHVCAALLMAAIWACSCLPPHRKWLQLQLRLSSKIQGMLMNGLLDKSKWEVRNYRKCQTVRP